MNARARLVSRRLFPRLGALALWCVVFGVQDAAARAPQAASDIGVMSYNIRYGTADDGPDSWSHRRGAVISVIRRHDPDVLGVQEALRFQLDELRAALPAYTEVGVGRDDGATAGEYAAILFRTARFTAADHGTLWLSDTPNVVGSKSWGNRIPRICTWVRLVERTTRRELVVFNLHLDHESQPSRVKSIQLLRRRIAGLEPDVPIIIAGDFNADEANPAIRDLLKPATGRRSLVNTVRARHPQADDVQTFNGFGRSTNRGMIDYIFVSDPIEVMEAHILRPRTNGRFPSDHHPVWARLRHRP